MVAEDGTVQLNKNVVNGSTPFLRLIGDLPSGTPVAFEAAFGWSWLADLQEGYGFEAHLVHPLRCKAIASARLKNDKVDAARRSTRSASSPTSPGQDGRSPDGRSSWPGCTGKPSWSASPPSGHPSRAPYRPHGVIAGEPRAEKLCAV
jgi:hypothetical protein